MKFIPVGYSKHRYQPARSQPIFGRVAKHRDAGLARTARAVSYIDSLWGNLKELKNGRTFGRACIRTSIRASVLSPQSWPRTELC
ncbi:hypothetical protein ABH944_003852 [Caballeronia udeis]|jgi:hypothetical protein|uniref:Transposase n=1 Tax=Caballeronia udeis TaxID=1232866 RepID=A0ABW8MIH3_9BURK